MNTPCGRFAVAATSLDMTTLSIELVVARHEEALAWLRRVPASIDVTVYNKGARLSELPRAGTIHTLPNIGREAHTYLHHLVTKYDNPAALTICVQGKPFDHAPDLHRFLRALAAGGEKFDGFRWLGFLLDADDRTGSRLFQSWSKNPERRPLDMAGFWRALFGERPVPDRFAFFGGGQFAVQRDVVRARPRAFYENALQVASAVPDAAHCFERTWDAVFGVDGVPPELRDRPLPVYLKPIRRLMPPPA
ncbi:MAG TPA: DUF3431 domain-containing protein [Kiritimatiellia bacterium]|nr:DUF3431 domain-containing protein [Kiritimatiellia bacterium]